MRVTDYNSGALPKNPDAIVIAGGAELQRALYALAARQLLPGVRRIDAHLVYLNDENRKFSLRDPDPCRGGGGPAPRGHGAARS